jgi:hypothetical protein
MSVARSVEELANAAALLLGEVPPFIEDLEFDTSKAGKCIWERLPDLRVRFLRKHHWNFAVDRKRLFPTYKTVTNVTDVGGKIRLTIAAHGWATGDRVTTELVEGVPAANGTYYITVIDVNTIELDDSVFAGAYTAGGRTTLAPQFDYAYKVAVPTGFLKVIHCDDKDSKLEGNVIVTNQPTVFLRYVKDVTDYLQWDSSAYEAFQVFIAIELCETITSSTEKKEALIKEFRGVILPGAKNQDATEDPHSKTDDDWLYELRQGGSRGFVRDPLT